MLRYIYPTLPPSFSPSASRRKKGVWGAAAIPFPASGAPSPSPRQPPPPPTHGRSAGFAGARAARTPLFAYGLRQTMGNRIDFTQKC